MDPFASFAAAFREVEQLLVHHGADGGLLGSLLEHGVSALLTASRESLIGKTIEHYEIVSLLGAGGMDI